MGSKHPKISDVIRDNSAWLMDLDYVAGVAEGERDGNPIILVMLSADSPAIRAKIPDELAGFRVQVEVTGEFKAL